VSQRLVTIYLPASSRESLSKLTHEGPSTLVEMNVGQEQLKAVYLVDTEAVEAFMDPLQTAFAGGNAFRLLVQPLSAALPAREKPSFSALSLALLEKKKPLAHRVSREELYEELADLARPDAVFLTGVVLSTVVAAIGLGGSSVAVVIAAMVIAPLLGPNMALALATTLGDGPLARRALKTTLAGILVAFLLSLLMGLLWKVDPRVPEIAVRSTLELKDLVLALAAGAAGALAFTSGFATGLVGVMVAVALLPPLVVFALLLAGGHTNQAMGAFSLLLANIICVNLAGVITFLLQGIRPRTWWEAERSARSSRLVLAVWILLLLLMTAFIIFWPDLQQS